MSWREHEPAGLRFTIEWDPVMRFLLPSAVVMFSLILGWAASANAQSGTEGEGESYITKLLRQKKAQDAAKKSQVAATEKPSTGKSPMDKAGNGNRATEKMAKDKSAKEKKAPSPASGAAVEGETAPLPKERQLANFERQRDAQIVRAKSLQHLALRKGDTNLAANASRMEAQANEEYAQKVLQLQQSDTTDPTKMD